MSSGKWVDRKTFAPRGERARMSALAGSRDRIVTWEFSGSSSRRKRRYRISKTKQRRQRRERRRGSPPVRRGTGRLRPVLEWRERSGRQAPTPNLRTFVFLVSPAIGPRVARPDGLSDASHVL